MHLAHGRFALLRGGLASADQSLGGFRSKLTVIFASILLLVPLNQTHIAVSLITNWYDFYFQFTFILKSTPVQTETGCDANTCACQALVLRSKILIGSSIFTIHPSLPSSH